MSRPPESKHTPLPTSDDPGMLPLAPFQLDKPRRPFRRSADGMDQRKILRQKIVADRRLDVGAVARSQRTRRRLELRRTHVVRRRVDQIARQRHRFDGAIEIVAIDALRQFQPDLTPFGLAVEREAVRAEREGERGKPRVMRIVGKPVDAIRQVLRQQPGAEQVLGFVGGFQAEQHAAESGPTRQQQVAAGLGLEARRIGKGADLAFQPLAQLRIARRGDEPDRDRLRCAARHEDRGHQLVRAPKLRPAITSPGGRKGKQGYARDALGSCAAPWLCLMP